MKAFLLFIIMLWPLASFAVPCDCEVTIFSPLTGPNQLPPNSLKTYELEEFASYSIKNQYECRQLCEKEFANDMSIERLRSLLQIYSERLIAERLIGYNCTGQTTLKYPVRVKAKLGYLGLGNVVDIVEIINHEEKCF